MAHSVRVFLVPVSTSSVEENICRDQMVKKESENMNALDSSYNEHIRPLLDAVDRLRHLKVMQEGIELPTIVVVGDQSSGKSSVLESLAGISLPRGQGICTRVPLIMRLQTQPDDVAEPELHLEYNDKTVPTSEAVIAEAINAATDEIAGDGKGISDTPLTLVVKKKGVPNLTMVDLPGITRVPVRGQPDNIYEQISAIIMKYISPKESIILNVLSATVDFPTCESIRMSQQVDRCGLRTLAVVTKADKAPEGLLEKVTADDVNIGLGYVCVRNRIGDESYVQARMEEARLFESHAALSLIDKSIVGIPVLAHKLMQIQAGSIGKCLPDVVKKIDQKLTQNISEFDQMPRKLTTVADAMQAFMHILSSSKEFLSKILVRGEFDDIPDDDTSMHGTARLADILNKYYKELPSECPFNKEDKFLMEEIDVLQETKGIGLPNFLPRAAFLTILRKKIGSIAHTPREFVRDVWAYVEDVVVRVLMQYADNYPQLQSSTRVAARNLMEKMKGRSYQYVKVLIEMEMLSEYTSNPDYMKTWSELMEPVERFMEVIQNSSKPTQMNLERFGYVDVGHLREYASMAEQAFDMRMRMTAYWRSVVLRLVDGLALHILHSVKTLVQQELQIEIVNEIVGPTGIGIERMLEESPSTTGKRERLRKSIELLKESKEVVANIKGRIVAIGA